MDQGMHLLDLSHRLLGPLPLQSALLRTNFWPVAVEDNAVLALGEKGETQGPWATFHVSWTEWKNDFALEIYCKRAKLQVTGLWGSYGPQVLRIYRMGPELGPPAAVLEYGDEDRRGPPSGNTSELRCGRAGRPTPAQRSTRSDDRGGLPLSGYGTGRSPMTQALRPSAARPPGRADFDDGWVQPGSDEPQPYLSPSGGEECSGRASSRSCTRSRAGRTSSTC
jgi:hypothetical protein